MEIVILLIPLALIFLAGAIAFLFWALRKDQFDDLDNASWRVVFDDREQRREKNPQGEAKENDNDDA
ncbi:MAG: cbb3-type cytochrome oxidase assembly protein CcoS [Pseudomonadota bacterium]|uniref:cbb3-type cytochrome oxidase assembly protein CcoS n=1 Tax=Alcanivorax sp. TaxID=1872427 RepID=UPI0024377D04|nr:cbb3-type cytochrome oxidase assembly protein CcoS [Alcanivorax sp.]MED5238305.1 cbb3-type cytochrome oxidase assembly protein CcoS [Pseudomonadota bacterium]MEE3320151.1 cbb3-type cytochrome oxidase assembly protein CcoS [Pseudomonadota bacterium]